MQVIDVYMCIVDLAKIYLLESITAQHTGSNYLFMIYEVTEVTILTQLWCL